MKAFLNAWLVILGIFVYLPYVNADVTCIYTLQQYAILHDGDVIGGGTYLGLYGCYDSGSGGGPGTGTGDPGGGGGTTDPNPDPDPDPAAACGDTGLVSNIETTYRMQWYFSNITRPTRGRWGNEFELDAIVIQDSPDVVTTRVMGEFTGGGVFFGTDYVAWKDGNSLKIGIVVTDRDYKGSSFGYSVKSEATCSNGVVVKNTASDFTTMYQYGDIHEQKSPWVNTGRTYYPQWFAPKLDCCADSKSIKDLRMIERHATIGLAWGIGTGQIGYKDVEVFEVGDTVSAPEGKLGDYWSIKAEKFSDWDKYNYTWDGVKENLRAFEMYEERTDYYFESDGLCTPDCSK